MTRESMSRIREFEDYVDKYLLSQDIFQYDRFECIQLVGGIVEEAWLSHIPIWYGGLNILVPLLLANKSGSKKDPSLELIIKTLELAQDYYHLRDYFYYTYNIPEAIRWDFDSENNVQIKIIDKSLPLQLFLELNNVFLGSTEMFRDFELGNEIETLVEKVENEFSPSTEVFQAYERCVEEAKVKLVDSSYTSFLSDDIIFDSYSVGEFREVYTHIIARSLLRRYFLRKRAKKGRFDFPSYLRIDRNDFVESLSEATGLRGNTVEEILKDLTLGDFKIEKRQSISSFPLIYNPQERVYYLFSHIVCFSNCFRSLRKLWALKDPSKYGEKIAPVVSTGFVRHVSKMFTDSGFHHVIKNIPLENNSLCLPDIDILAFWKEKGFGFVVFACELKSSIPESFGKDYVSSIGPKGYLTKALRQISIIHSFLNGGQFVKLLKGSLPPESFEYGLYALNFLVITPHNIGVFVAKDEARVIDHQTLRYILKSSKGDILRLLQLLDKDKFEQTCSNCYTVFYKTSQFGKYKIRLPLVGLIKIMRF